MATTIEVIKQMQANAEKARQNAQNGGPKAFVSNSIVLLQKDQRALVRPVYNMDSAITLPIHDKYKNTDAALAARPDGKPAPISAICATAIGKPCLFCNQPKEAKLEARMECFLPVFLFRVQQEIADNEWEDCFYVTPDGESKPIRGFRMLRLKQGSSVLDHLMTIFSDADYSNDVTSCDHIVVRRGEGLDTKYTPSNKPPKGMEPNLKAAIPGIEKFKEILFEIYPVRTLEKATLAGKSVNGAPDLGKLDDDFTF